MVGHKVEVYGYIEKRRKQGIAPIAEQENISHREKCGSFRFGASQTPQAQTLVDGNLLEPDDGGARDGHVTAALTFGDRVIIRKVGDNDNELLALPNQPPH